MPTCAATTTTSAPAARARRALASSPRGESPVTDQGLPDGSGIPFRLKVPEMTATRTPVRVVRMVGRRASLAVRAVPL